LIYDFSDWIPASAGMTKMLDDNADAENDKCKRN